MQATRERFFPPLAFALSGSQPPELTPRQRDILGHIAQGRSNKQIARHLGVHPSTVGRWFTPAINGAKEETS